MATTTMQPVTRDELRDVVRHELQHELQHYATKADLHQLENRLIRWMVGMMLGGMATAATLSIALQRLLGE